MLTLCWEEVRDLVVSRGEGANIGAAGSKAIKDVLDKISQRFLSRRNDGLQGIHL